MQIIIGPDGPTDQQFDALARGDVIELLEGPYQNEPAVEFAAPEPAGSDVERADPPRGKHWLREYAKRKNNGAAKAAARAKRVERARAARKAANKARKRVMSTDRFAQLEEQRRARVYAVRQSDVIDNIQFALLPDAEQPQFVGVPDLSPKLPEGAIIAGAHLNVMNREFEFLVYHESFDAVPVGQMAPRWPEPLKVGYRVVELRKSAEEAKTRAVLQTAFDYVKYTLEFFGWAKFPALEGEVEKLRDQLRERLNATEPPAPKEQP